LGVRLAFVRGNLEKLEKVKETSIMLIRFARYPNCVATFFAGFILNFEKSDDIVV
jgi:hypothetical protein